MSSLVFTPFFLLKILNTLFSPSATNTFSKLLLLIARQFPYPLKPVEYSEFRKVFTPIFGPNGYNVCTSK